MKKINIKATSNTPSINLDKNSLIIKGRSIRNNKMIFQKTLEELDNVNKNNFTLSFFLDYIDTTTIHYLYKIMKKMEEFNNPLVKWYYENGDDFIKEGGLDFQKMFNITNFNIIEK